MQVAFGIAHWYVRLAGVLLLLLGLLFWTGDALGLIPMHMLLGIVLVLALWVMAAIAAMSGAPPSMTVGAALLALVVLVVGVSQTNVLPGGAHWVIQALHLILGMAAVGVGEMMAARLRRARLQPSEA